MNKFNQVVAGALDIAHSEAMERKNTEIYPIHLLWGLYKNPSSFLSKNLKPYKKVMQDALSHLPTASTSVGMDQLRANAKLSEWLTKASSLAIQNCKSEVTETELLRYLPEFFRELNLNIEEIMKGTHEGEEEVPSFLVNLNEFALAMRRMPPKTMAAVASARKMPVQSRGTPRLSCAAPATVLP